MRISSNTLVRDPDALRYDFSGGPLDIDQLERRFLIEAIKAARGNVSKAARMVGLNRGALRYRIERLQLEGVLDEASARASDAD
ncbi:helix-turn-helix domain-containing protein [Pseudanabaena sp. CCNP1317]|uniref:helix-turn-helix domain-containing protein n=1 Tax=Pseudanabaena sp. CCNP1317 TaxID=3110253 RepID=UPI002B21366D|nr:helix-turn-helix domain-containing protein [Pseudanabaena sp. CCNP1317]